MNDAEVAEVKATAAEADFNDMAIAAILNEIRRDMEKFLLSINDIGTGGSTDSTSEKNIANAAAAADKDAIAAILNEIRSHMEKSRLSINGFGTGRSINNTSEKNIADGAAVADQTAIEAIFSEMQNRLQQSSLRINGVGTAGSDITAFIEPFGGEDEVEENEDFALAFAA
ncbi:Uu.00g123480.m01.CDS01 [Anthostomella pinea]|uniref:Uu.00g123480.m01.CDS01 n=1 Tax=Anthostomella pinea TaxID=933095 RepID=A0AAI8VHA9_9PEZI|nr:Uu.00g123480.m01.CDS01 [Anthostomella pinea]